MNQKPLSLCITCSHEVGEPPQLNRLPNGLPCPSCRDRILAFLPAPLPGPGSAEFVSEVELAHEPAAGAGQLYAVDFSDHDEPA